MPHATQFEAFARECEQAWDGQEAGIVMFTSGSSGTPKATLLPWDCITGAATAANRALALESRGVWQMVLPMCHIGGFQIMVRSLLSGGSFIVYERYNPVRVLNDVLSFRVTHISVVDKILADLLENDRDKVIGQYACILLGGAGAERKDAAHGFARKSKLVLQLRHDGNFQLHCHGSGNPRFRWRAGASARLRCSHRKPRC